MACAPASGDLTCPHPARAKQGPQTKSATLTPCKEVATSRRSHAGLSEAQSVCALETCRTRPKHEPADSESVCLHKPLAECSNQATAMLNYHANETPPPPASLTREAGGLRQLLWVLTTLQSLSSGGQAPAAWVPECRRCNRVS